MFACVRGLLQERTLINTHTHTHTHTGSARVRAHSARRWTSMQQPLQNATQEGLTCNLLHSPYHFHRAAAGDHQPRSALAQTHVERRERVMQPPPPRSAHRPISLGRIVQNIHRHDGTASPHCRRERRIILQPQILPKPNESGSDRHVPEEAAPPPQSKPPGSKFQRNRAKRLPQVGSGLRPARIFIGPTTLLSPLRPNLHLAAMTATYPHRLAHVQRYG